MRMAMTIYSSRTQSGSLKRRHQQHMEVDCKQVGKGVQASTKMGCGRVSPMKTIA